MRPLASLALGALVATSGCAAILAKPGKVLVRNQTGATPFCRVELKQDSRTLEYWERDIAVGAQSEVAVKSGRRKICVKACETRTSLGGERTNVVGCAEIDVSSDAPTEIVIADGPDIPEVPATPGYRQVMWGNNVNPTFSETSIKPWLDPYGRLRDGVLHMTLAHPGTCSKTVGFKWEDRKGLGDSGPLDPKDTVPVFNERPPVWLSFAVGNGEPKKVWDLPPGVYSFRVRDDCSGLDLVDEQHAAGTKDKAKPIAAR